MRSKESHQTCRARLMPALELFESALDKPSSLEEAAWSCCLSPFHFHRLFHRTIGAAPASYLRERRLSRAARELLAGERSGTDLAFRWGYGSPESFSRAFRGQFHLNPSGYRRQGRPLFLRESELDCPLEVAGPSHQETSCPFLAPTRRMVGLFLHGENDHPANMRRLYEFFVGREVDDLAQVPGGLDVLEIPPRDEVSVDFLGSVDELHEMLPGSIEATLGARGLEQAPLSWKLERPSGPVRWTRCGFRQSVQVRER